MANPRKFSDKLEIIRRKEEEANAAFVQIMREVSDARKGNPVHSPHIPPHQQNSWMRNSNDYMKMRQKYKGGSLPNVNLSPNPSVNLQQRNVTFADIHFIKELPLYPTMNDGFGQQQQQQQYGGGVAGGHGRRNMEPPAGPVFPSRNKYRSYTVNSPYRNNLVPQLQQSLLEEQNEPPSTWRRTYSDSAIQQTLQLPPRSITNGSAGNVLQTSNRIIQSQNQSADGFARSTSVNLQFADNNSLNSSKNHINIQADTSSLPDLSNLSIPSPIQNPIDAEHEGKGNTKQRDQQNHFQVPYRIPPRRMGGKSYRQINSNPDVLETLHREQKNLNLFPEVSVATSSQTGINTNTIISQTVSAPLSPVAPPPFFWNNTISALGPGDVMQQPSSAATDLQQQLFQIQNDNLRNNGIGNPPPYAYQSDDDDSYSHYCSNNYLPNKQNIYRINSGPTHLCSNNSKSICDHQLENALMRVKAEQVGDLVRCDLPVDILRSKQLGNELSQADLNSVRVALDPLDFDDVQMLTDSNAQIVDQHAEEQFRLERDSYL